MTYMISIKYAFVIFPIIAFFITFPYMVIEYHKYGSISLFRSALIYLFILYLITAYFLVILPLPKIEEVELLTTQRVQLIPFRFIYDFIRETPLVLTNIKTYKAALLDSTFYVPIFNVLLTIPFGMFLKYYKKLETKKIVKYTFLFSLFFELTQLTGLYFIYPRGYRICDIDDLIQNTLGGYLGALIAIKLIKYLPNIDKLNEESFIKGKSVSGLKRTTSMILDLFIYLIIDFVLFIITNNFELSSIILLIIYYIIVPFMLNGSTLGQLFIHLKEESNSKKYVINVLLVIIRKILFIILYIAIPFGMVFSLFYIFNDIISEMSVYTILGLLLIFYLIISIKFLFTSKPMLYEKITRTKLISTIKTNNDIIKKGGKNNG